MRVTIIASDGFVSIDEEGYEGIDLSFMNADIHALQWYGNDGEIERKDERGRIVSNEEITDITPYQSALDLWQVAKESAEQAAKENAEQAAIIQAEMDKLALMGVN